MHEIMAFSFQEQFLGAYALALDSLQNLLLRLLFLQGQHEGSRNRYPLVALFAMIALTASLHLASIFLQIQLPISKVFCLSFPAAKESANTAKN